MWPASWHLNCQCMFKPCHVSVTKHVFLFINTVIKINRIKCGFKVRSQTMCCRAGFIFRPSCDFKYVSNARFWGNCKLKETKEAAEGHLKAIKLKWDLLLWRNTAFLPNNLSTIYHPSIIIPRSAFTAVFLIYRPLWVKRKLNNFRAVHTMYRFVLPMWQNPL